jgi:hypothetical protein
VKTRRVLTVTIGLALAATPARAGDVAETPYVYHRTPGAAGDVTVEAETAYGTREARPFGEQGVEQAVRVTVTPTDRLSFGVRGGLVVDEQADAAVMIDGAVRAGWGGVDLVAVAGWGRDYRGSQLVRLTLGASRSWGRFNLSARGIGEIPFAEGRDAADLIVGVALSRELGARFRVGVEAAGEDIEGLWEPDEAEGGARLLVGPTLWMTRGGMFVGLNGSGFAGQSGSGFLGRLVVGMTFR